MAVKYHVNSAGEPGKCSAKEGGCPFGGEDSHFGNADVAREVYELRMRAESIPQVMTKGAERMDEYDEVTLEDHSELTMNDLPDRTDIITLEGDELSSAGFDSEQIKSAGVRQDEMGNYYSWTNREVNLSNLYSDLSTVEASDVLEENRERIQEWVRDEYEADLKIGKNFNRPQEIEHSVSVAPESTLEWAVWAIETTPYGIDYDLNDRDDKSESTFISRLKNHLSQYDD